MTGNSDLRGIAIQAADAGAHAILEAVGSGRIDVEMKTARHDLVTTADRAAEHAIITAIRQHRPNDRIHAEESGEHPADGGGGTLWLIDPLDGTTNFVHHRNDFAVSIAAVDDNGADLAAVIHRPADGRWLAVSPSGFDGTLQAGTTATVRASEALVSIGFPHAPGKRPSALAALARLMPAVRDFRRIGSAACDLLAVATGTLDAYVGFDLAPWDYAAGHALVRAAGGAADVTSVPDGLTAAIGAASQPLLDELIAALSAEDAVSPQGRPRLG